LYVLKGAGAINKYTIRPLRLGTIRRKKESMSYHCGVDEIWDFPLISYYLEGDGSKIIVDTGGSAPDGRKWQPYFRKKNERLDRALFDIGVSPAEINLVIFTHLHWDHAGNNRIFSNARFVVQKKELDYLLSPEPKVKAGYEADLVMRTKYETIDGDCEIVPGISVVLTPGHTVGMQCVVVETASDKYILGGDLITLLENWEAVPPIPSGNHYNLELMKKSLDRVQELHGKILPGHDEKVFKQKI
jgi:N-acyl homoserine lactone hydrolase